MRWPRLLLCDRGGFIWLVQIDVALMLLDSGLDETAGLRDVDLTALLGHAAYTKSLESQVILHSPTEAGILRRGWSHRRDVLPGQQCADASESRAYIQQENTETGF
jgi:hypothetical protein